MSGTESYDASNSLSSSGRQTRRNPTANQNIIDSIPNNVRAQKKVRHEMRKLDTLCKNQKRTGENQWQLPKIQPGNGFKKTKLYHELDDEAI